MDQPTGFTDFFFCSELNFPSLFGLHLFVVQPIQFKFDSIDLSNLHALNGNEGTAKRNQK